MEHAYVTALMVVLTTLCVFSCLYLFCCFLPRQEHGEYYDRSEIMNYVRDHEGENMGDNEAINIRDDDGGTNLEQVEAMERMDLIHERVIKKKVIHSDEASNRKSNIRIPFSAMVRNWVSRLPSIIIRPTSAPTQDAVKLPDAKPAARRTRDRTPDSPKRTSVTFREDDLSVEEESLRSKQKRWAGDSWANGSTLEPTPDDEGIGTQELTDRRTSKFSHSSTDDEGIGTQELMDRQTSKFSYSSTLTTLSRSLRSFGSSKSVPYTPDKCLICMESYKVDDKVYWSPNDSCDHSFHADCMFRWLMNNDDCPLCRQNYLNGSVEVGGEP